MCLNHLLPLSFSSVCKKFPRQSRHEVFSVADLGDPRHLQPSSTFHCELWRETYIIVTFLDTATQTIQLTCTIIHRTDPLRQWPECGGGWKANAEANHRSSARDAVLVPPDQPWQQRRRPAASCVHHDCTRHSSHKTLPDQQDKLGWHGDCGTTDSRDIRESEVCGEDPINGGF